MRADVQGSAEALKQALLDLSTDKVKVEVILAGVECHRLGIQRELQDLIEHSGYPFATGLLGKTVIPEEHPQFIGVYGGVNVRWARVMPT